MKTAFFRCVIICLFGILYSESAQSGVLLTNSSNSDLIALKKNVAVQQVEIQSLQRDLKYEVRDIRWWFLVAGVIIAILSAFGYQTYTSIDDQIRKKIRRIISKNLYQLDLNNLEVYMSKRLDDGEYKVHNFKEILNAQGIEMKLFDERLTKKSFQGITVLPIENNDDESAFLKFIEINNNQLNPKKAGFILYASTSYRLDPHTLNKYPTTVIANTVWNLASILIVMGRSLTPLSKYDD
jgi:hypothetical protein